MSANDRQEGGDHYKQFKGFEPWDAVQHFGLGYLDGNALKYICRWRIKGGIDDLRKAIHYLEKMIEVLEGEVLRSIAPLDEKFGVAEELMMPVAYTKYEGAAWVSWPSKGGIQKWYLDSWGRRYGKSADHVLILPVGVEDESGVSLHSLKFADDRTWDSINGWRRI